MSSIKEDIDALAGRSMVPELAAEVVRQIRAQSQGEPRLNRPYEYGVLYMLKGAKLDITTDQVFEKMGTFTHAIIQGVSACNASATPTSAAGGIYTGANKGGNAIIAAGTSWANLNSATRCLNITLAATQHLANGAPILSLTTATSVSGATCDIYIMGVTVP